jgi:phenylalanyl-tRNA synthetase alpha chain
MAVNGRIEELKNAALSAVRGAETTAALEEARVRYLGRSAELTEIKKSIGTLSPEERMEVGRSANLASREIEGRGGGHHAAGRAASAG